MNAAHGPAGRWQAATGEPWIKDDAAIVSDAEREAARRHYRNQAARFSTDDLNDWHAESSYLLALADADELDDNEASRAWLLSHLAAINAELATRKRLRLAGPVARALPYQAALEALKARVTVLDLVGYLMRADVSMKQAGRSWRGPCPFCMADNPTTLTAFEGNAGARFHCFRCSASGDVVTAVQLITRCTFPEAVSAAAVLFQLDHLLSDAA